MSKSFLQRLQEKRPKYHIEATITGVKFPNGTVHMCIDIDGEDNHAVAANILEMAAQVLRKGDDQ